MIISIASIVLNVITIIISYKKRMTVYAIGTFFFLSLVSGQSLQIAFDLSDAVNVQYLQHFINLSGFDNALIYLLLTSSILLAIPLICSTHRGVTFRNVTAPKIGILGSWILYLITTLNIFLLIFFIVGWQTFISSTRPGVISGSTIFLVMLSIGIYPLLSQVICRERMQWKFIVLFLLVLIVTLLFSRIHVIVYGLIFFVAWFYSSGTFRKKVNRNEVFKIIIIGFAFMFIFLGIGTIRDTLNFVSGGWDEIFEYAIENIDSGILSVRYNYIASVEGMSGIAGAFTYLDTGGEQTIDFGLAQLVQGFFQWIPGFLKIYTTPYVEEFTGGNWYQSSIVPSGFESSFISFGWCGIFVFPLIFYFISNYLTMIYIKSKSINAKITALILIGMEVFFIRGSWSVWIAYSVSYLLIFIAYKFFLRFNFFSIPGK